LFVIAFTLKHLQKVTFQEDPFPFSLWELRSFKQELALLVRVKFIVLCHDIESLSLGAQTYMLAFLVFLGQDFPGTPNVQEMKFIVT
jgi:hypothetical protein